MSKSNHLPSTANFEGLFRKGEQYVRRAPRKAVGMAFISGLLMHVLPIRLILSTLLRIALSAGRPALLLLGVVKACDACRIEPPVRKPR